MPLDVVLDALRTQGHESRRLDKDWRCRCPAHEDNNPSLSIKEGDDGRVLVHCFAGCPPEAVVEALHLKMSDLMPVDTVDVDTNQKNSRKTAFVSASAPTVYTSARDAVAQLEHRHGPRSATWTYHNDKGEPVGVVVRWDNPTGKDIRPVSRNGRGWILGGMSEPRPLYGLPELLGVKPNQKIYVTEGEKATDAARSIGLLATTSAHGSKSAAKTDWSPLAGRHVVILLDNDDPGQGYADDVTALLEKLNPPAIVGQVLLPGLTDGGDIFDFVEDRRGAGQEDGQIRNEVDRLGDESLPAQLPEPPRNLDRYEPFPVDVLPKPIRTFISTCAIAIGCDESFVALPLLAALASAIGNSYRIQLKQGWTEPAIVWAAVVSASGTQKSPALEVALGPVRKRQHDAIKDHNEAVERYEEDLLRWERDTGEWKRNPSTSPPPTKPVEPVPERFWCDDVTVEALAGMLLQNPRGLLQVRDELSGWLGSFDRYAQGRGGDVAKWLEMFGGRSMVVDRKTGANRTLYVPRASVSVCGCIQPGALRRVLGREYFENGLAARLLMAYPPRRPKRWTEAEISSDIERSIEAVFERLYDLKPAQDENGDPQPMIVRLNAQAKPAWVAFYNAHAQEQVSLAEDLSAAWSKLEGYAPRLALVVHCVRWAANDPTLASPNEVDAQSIETGIALSQWFGREAKRVYAMMNESDEDRQQQRLIEVVRGKGGSVTPRDLMRSSRKFKTAEDAEAALDNLVKARQGRWAMENHDGGRGRPVRRFLLADTVDVDTNTINTEKNPISVNVNTVNEAGDKGEWGEV